MCRRTEQEKVSSLPPPLDEFSAKLSYTVAMSKKDKVAQTIAKAHARIEPSIKLIVRVLSPQEDDVGEPIKLLEVNPATYAEGILPIALGAAPPEVPYPSVVIEVNEEEYGKIVSRPKSLPNGWTLGMTLFTSPAA